MAERKGIYATQPVVKGKRITTKNPVGTVQTGSLTPVPVPQHAGQIHGLGPVERPFGHPSVKGAHGWGHVAHLKQGHLRLSGMTSAHRLGASPKGKKAPTTT